MKKFYYNSWEQALYYESSISGNSMHYFEDFFSLRQILDFAIPFEEDIEDSKIVTLFLFARRNK